MVEGQPKVSVIIPVYNAECYLCECLNSVRAQTLKDIEIICVDDGSTDRSLEILREFSMIDKRIRVETQKNLYAGVARNTGMKLAHGEYYVFLDSDDFFEPDMLELEYKRCKEAQADICLCSADKYNTATQEYLPLPRILDISLIPFEPFSILDVNDVYAITQPNPWTKMFSAEFIKHHNLRFQDLVRSNDCYFVYSALALAKKIVTVNQPLVHYRVNSGLSLQDTKENTPTLFCSALLATKEKLIEAGVYESVEQSFLDAVIRQTQYQL